MNLRQQTTAFHLTRYARGPATEADKNRGVKDHSYWGMRTSFHPNEEQMEAIRDKMRRIAKSKLG